MLERLQQRLDLGDVGFGQAVALGEMGDERRHPAAEHAVDQPARFLGDIIGAGDGRAVEIAPPLLLMGEDALGEQPGEHGLDGADAPAALGRDPRGDLGGGQRRLLPEHLHHRIFGFPDPLHRAPSLCSTTGVVTGALNGR